jgi:glycosyltransferase involved in cell wall biosynthesis
MLAEAWEADGTPHHFVQVASYRTALERVLSPLRGRDSVSVVRPWPGPPRKTWHRRSRAELDRAFRRAAARLRRDMDGRIDWATSVAMVVTPAWAPWLAELPFGAVIYDCIDELDVHVATPALRPLFVEWERELVERCDAAVVTAVRLEQYLRKIRADLPMATIRNGVDAAWFQRVARESPRPADLPGAERPIVGFVGALYRWIDWGLIEATVTALPEFQFVFVGPDDGNAAIARLSGRKNVRFLGRKAYAEVPAYMQAFDVCWVPFTQDDISNAANPVKIYEYLALGKPVVSTPVADTELFGDVVRVVSTAAEAAEAIRAARAAEEDAQRRERRMAFAAENTWAARARKYAAFAARLLARKRGAAAVQ